MARGKHTQSAAARHAIAEATSTVETYQAAVRRLTAENHDLKAKLLEQASAHSREVRKLKAERDEGVGPMVDVLRGQLVDAQETVRLQHGALGDMKHHWDNAKRNIRDHFVHDHGMPVPQAMGKLLEALQDADWGAANVPVITNSVSKRARGLTRRQAYEIARARGETT